MLWSTCAPQQEKPRPWKVCRPQLEGRPRSLQLEKAWVQQWRPSTANNKSMSKKKKKLKCPWANSYKSPLYSWDEGTTLCFSASLGILSPSSQLLFYYICVQLHHSLGDRMKDHRSQLGAVLQGPWRMKCPVTVATAALWRGLGCYPRYSGRGGLAIKVNVPK